MGGDWKSFENLLNRFGIWATAFTAMTGIFGWIASHLTFLKPYGWAEAAFAGLIAALAVVAVLSLALIAWRRFRPLEQNATAMAAQSEPASVLSSTQEQAFRDALKTTNARLDSWVALLTEKIEASRKNSIEVMAETNFETEEALKLKLHSAEEEHAARLRQVAEEIQRHVEASKALERDVTRLIFFATDLVTLAVLEEQVAEGCRIRIPLGPGVEMAERQNQSAKATQFIQSVRSTYSGTHRGIEVNGCVQNAENEAERELSETPPHERPTHIDVLEYRRLKIVEHSRLRLVAYLQYQRAQKKAEIRRQRPDLLERLQARNSS